MRRPSRVGADQRATSGRALESAGGDHLVATKLALPATRRTLVARPRLLARLDEALATPLTVVSAPAGFGPLPRVIDEGAAFVARNRRLVPRMEGIRRIDVSEYPDFSVREAIANAVAHRDWSLDGAKVRLFIFDDRLEIWSPGKLPPPITLERLGFDQFSRNKIIARVLLELGYIEEVGLGIRRMREEAARLHLPEPEFREDGFSFVVTFHSIAPREGVAPAADPFQSLLERGEINERQYRGLLFVRAHGIIARRAYVDLTGTSERTATRDLAVLVEKNLLESAGGRGSQAAYRLKDRTDTDQATIGP